jgi:signal transduction histidine kinase
MADSRFAAGLALAMLAWAALALAWAIAALLAVDPEADFHTTYAAALPALRVADIAAGLGLLVAGGLAFSQPRTRRLGLLAMLAGVAWFGPDWEGAEQGPELLRSLGALIAPFALVLVLHLALALPAGRIRSQAARAALVVAYATAAVVSIGRALFRDPLLDLYCWRTCRDNAFLVDAKPGVASTLGDIWLWSALAIAVGLVAFALHRLRASSGPARRAALPLLGPAVLVGASEAAYAVALLGTPMEDPERTGFAAVFVARSLSYTLLAFGLAWTVLRVPRARARVARLASDLGEAPPPGTLRDTLAAAVGDPGIDVVYPRGDSDQLIDEDGHPAELASAGRGIARITRGGRTLALVLHDPALVDEPELARALGSAAKLAVENEALRAEALGQLHELQASRTRIVETSDAARRRLERNLHDGAQQRLLALSYDLRVARAGVVDDGAEQLVPLLDVAVKETDVALEELRELAHGIYPAILTEAGLAPALATLADEAPLPVELRDVPPERQPPSVETTAYALVAETIEDAARRGATVVTVHLRREGSVLVLAVDDDGAPRSSPPVHLADRVGALAGSLDVGDTTMRAEIPCE